MSYTEIGKRPIFVSSSRAYISIVTNREQEMTMTKRNQTLKRGGPFADGVLIDLSVVTPVFSPPLFG